MAEFDSCEGVELTDFVDVLEDVGVGDVPVAQLHLAGGGFYRHSFDVESEVLQLLALFWVLDSAFAHLFHQFGPGVELLLYFGIKQYLNI